MRRVSIVFLFIMITIIISYQNVIFAAYSSEALEEELHQQIEQTFKERSRIWNQFLMGQYSSIDEVKKDLKKSIANPLLKSDIEMFEQMLNNPTSYEGISKVTLKNISIVNNSLNEVELKIILLWDVMGYENEYSEEIEYKVKMKKRKDGWLLSSYEISE